MRKSILSGLFLAILIPVLAHAESDRTDDRAAILAMMERGSVGIGADFEAWARNFHPDWTIWMAGSEAAREREAHMALVRDYLAQGAEVEAYELDLVRLNIYGDQAVLDYNAVETIREADGGLRIVRYSATAVLVREAGRWLIRTTSLSFPERYATTTAESEDS